MHRWYFLYIYSAWSPSSWIFDLCFSSLWKISIHYFFRLFTASLLLFIRLQLYMLDCLMLCKKSLIFYSFTSVFPLSMLQFGEYILHCLQVTSHFCGVWAAVKSYPIKFLFQIVQYSHLGWSFGFFVGVSYFSYQSWLHLFTSIYVFSCNFFFFLHLWHMKVLGPGIKSKLQLLPMQ